MGNPEIIYHDNGQMKSKGTFKDGIEDGLHTEWYENGQKSEETTYKDGMLMDWTEWYGNGQKSEEITYKDGELGGLHIEWYENGQKKSEGSCNYARFPLIRKYWNEDGSVKE